MEEEWYRTCLSQHGMAVARDAKFVLALTSDRPLPKNAMTLLPSQIWQNFHVDNTSVHVTRSPTGGNLVVLPRNAYNHAPTGSNRPEEEYYRRTGATSARQRRSMYFSTPDDDPQRNTLDTAANGPRPITVEPHANNSYSSTNEPVEPAEELAGSPSHRISDNRVRFQPEQKSYYTCSGRPSKTPCQYNV